MQVQAQHVAIDAVLSELELLVTQLVGVGIYDLQPKQWRQRLRDKATVDELCECRWAVLTDCSRVFKVFSSVSGQEHCCSCDLGG